MASLPVKMKDVMNGASLSYLVRVAKRKTRLTNHFLIAEYCLRNLLNLMIDPDSGKNENKKYI
jgi:hypothetical protein